MPSPRELWLEERCKYLEDCLSSLGFKTDPESFYAHRSELMAAVLEPVIYKPVQSICVPWAVRVEADCDLTRFGWEIKVQTAKTATSDYKGIAMHVVPPANDNKLVEYAGLLLKDMMTQLVREYWGSPQK